MPEGPEQVNSIYGNGVHCSTDKDYLYSIKEDTKAIRANQEETAGDGNAILYERISFDASVAIPLPNIPADAKTAIIVIEADPSSSNLLRVARFVMSDVAPTIVLGMPIGDNGLFEIRRHNNMNAFLIIGIEAGKTHFLNVHYFD